MLSKTWSRPNSWLAGDWLARNRQTRSRARTTGQPRADSGVRTIPGKSPRVKLSRLHVPVDRQRHQRGRDDPQHKVFAFVFLFRHKWSTAYLKPRFKCRADFPLSGSGSGQFVVILSKRFLRSEGSGRAARCVASFATHKSRVWLASLSPRLRQRYGLGAAASAPAFL